MDALHLDELVGLFETVSAVMTDRADELGRMDAAMGDGDLGLTMSKGFAALPAVLAGLDDPDVGRRLAKAGLRMSSVVPSTMGTLMATGLLAGGKALTSRSEIDADGLATFFEAFAAGIAQRGRCAPGDRTVLDALHPAGQAARVAAQEPDATLASVADAALAGALAGVEASKDMTPKFGKAAVFAAKAAGVPDQGACAGAYFVRAWRDYVRDRG